MFYTASFFRVRVAILKGKEFRQNPPTFSVCVLLVLLSNLTLIVNTNDITTRHIKWWKTSCYCFGSIVS